MGKESTTKSQKLFGRIHFRMLYYTLLLDDCVINLGDYEKRVSFYDLFKNSNCITTNEFFLEASHYILINKKLGAALKQIHLYLNSGKLTLQTFTDDVIVILVRKGDFPRTIHTKEIKSKDRIDICENDEREDIIISFTFKR